MIERILTQSRDSKDYVTAASFILDGLVLTQESAQPLLALYEKHLAGADRGTAKLFLAADMLPGRGREDGEDFAPLELPGGDLDALFTARELMEAGREVPRELAGSIAEKLSGTAQSEAARVVLARIALDTLAGAGNFRALLPEVYALAKYLTGLGAGTMDKYMDLIMEVKQKCQS